MSDERQTTEQPDLTLDEWLIEARAELARFAAEWRTEAMNSPDIYPERMPVGEWNEQVRCWTGG